MRQFYKKSADILGMPRFTPEEVTAYRRLCGELFEEPRKVLVERGTVAADQMLDGWLHLSKTVGRRSGPAVAAKKMGMNMLSYEARVAVHRCYCCMWTDLIPHLATRYSLDPRSQRLLDLLHVGRMSESTTPGVSWHLFHGHVFALHPGIAMLMRTAAGLELVGNYLQAETAKQQLLPFQELLAGIYTSLCFYMSRRDEGRRTKSPMFVGDQNLNTMSADQR